MTTGRSIVYCKYYDGQLSGQIPIFRSGQYGGGLGDMLRGFARFITPIAMRGIATFANTALESRERGASYKDAVRSAIVPSLKDAFVQAFKSPTQQEGGSALFKGEVGIPFADEHVYKSSKKRNRVASQHGSKKQIAKRKRVHHADDESISSTYNF